MKGSGIFRVAWALARGGRSVNVGTPELGCKIRCEPTREDVTREVMAAIAQLPALLELAEHIALHAPEGGSLAAEAARILQAARPI